MDQYSLSDAPTADRADTGCTAPTRALNIGGVAVWNLRSALLSAAARYPYLIFLTIACFYCLLTYIPFTYYAIIQNPFLSWLTWFVRLFKYIFIVTALPITLALHRDSAGLPSRRIARAFAIVHASLAIALLFAPPLTSLPHDYRCLFLSIVIPFPLCWAGLVDHSVFAETEGWTRVPTGRAISAAAFIRPLAAVAAVSALISCARYAATTHTPLRTLAAAVSFSVVSQLLLGVIALASLALARFALTRRRASAIAEFVASSTFLWLAISIVLRKLVLASLSLNNAAANAFSVIVALQIVIFLTGLAVRLYSSAPAASVDAFSLPFYFIAPLFSKRKYLALLWLVLAASLAYEIPRYLQQSDWDALFQRLTATFIWCAALAFALSHTRPRTHGKRQPILMLLLLLFSFVVLLQVSNARTMQRYIPCTSDHCLADALEEYAGFDPSFRAVHDVISPALQDSEHADFYKFLQRNTNIEASVQPTDVNLVDNLHFTPEHKPNIFIFVVDSLRQDYLSPYNPKVDFTPYIDRFARESVVMQNAFTRYGGTALAEASIWAGAMQVHKQYVHPYYPMNTLQKLLEAERYHSLITLDPIMRQLLGPSNSITELDRDTRFQNYDLCGTLKEIQSRIDSRSDSRPIFAYTQSLNLHLFGLHLARDMRQPKRDYPGFDRDHASELERLDAGFGEFIQYLKGRGLYDDSIIVLTSDHGDFIGEYGKFGHDGPPLPELLRVPLIIHIPSAMRDKLFIDDKQIAFNADISPTLYYLLGHTGLHNNEVLGRPLFVATSQEAAAWRRTSYLVASSYMPIYGVLEDEGRKFFLADAQAGTSYYYYLAKDPKGSHNRITNELRDRGEQLIRQHIGELNSFYHLNIN